MAQRTPVEILKAARERIADPERWCQKAYARGKSGRVDIEEGRAAQQWCAIGAVGSIAFSRQAYEAKDHLQVAADRLFSTSIITVNDVHGHEAVLRVYDAAIADAEAQP